MLTICAAPKPFHGHIGVIQRNAIRSWASLRPRPQIILFGKEEGAAETAHEFGLTHVGDVARNRRGTPLLASVLALAETHGKGTVLAYVNADIILPSTLTEAVGKVRHRFTQFLAIGRRTNLRVDQPLDFAAGWEEKLLKRLAKEGKLESHTGIDFFVFPRGTYKKVPPLVIGRVWFDQWLIKYALQNGLPVVDVTGFVPIAHQLHDYNHVAGGREWGTYGGEEAEENLAYYGERPHTYTILSATHVMTRRGGIWRAPFRREAQAVSTFLWDVLVNKTARVRKRIGLTRAGTP